MGWWEDLQSGLGIVPNAVGDTNQAIAASPVAQAARTNGSFDPNSLAAQLPPELAPDIRAMGAIDQARMAAMEKAYAKKTRTPLEFFGQALSAASVPVAYAQGNTGYANAMTGNTEADKFNAMNRDLELKRRAAMAGVGDSSLTSLGEGAMNYLGDRRKRRDKTRDEVARIMRGAVKPDGTLDPEIMAMAEQYAVSAGFGDIWEDVKRSINPKHMDAAPHAPTAAQAGPNAQAAPGTTPETTPIAPPPMLKAFGQQAMNIDGAQKPEAPPPVYERPAHVQALYDRAQKLALIGDPRSDIVLKQAEIADKAAAKVYEEKQTANFQRNAHFGTPVFLRNRETGHQIVGQMRSQGGIAVAEYIDTATGKKVSQEHVDLSKYDPITKEQSAAFVKQGEAMGNNFNKIQEAAQNAISDQYLLDLGRGAIESGLYTGSMGSAAHEIRKAWVSMGLGSEEQAKQVQAGDMLEAITNRLALGMRQGGQMPGALSDNDIKFLKASQFGLDKSHAANKAMLQAMQMLNQRKIDIAEQAVKYASRPGGKGYLDAGWTKYLKDWAEANPLFSDKNGPTPQWAPYTQRQSTGGTPAAPAGGKYQNLTPEEINKRLSTGGL